MHPFWIMEMDLYGGWRQVWTGSSKGEFYAQVQDYLERGSVPGDDFLAIHQRAFPADAHIFPSKEEARDAAWDARADAWRKAC